MKTLSALRGIAIIAVVLGHAIDWVYWGQAQWLGQLGSSDLQVVGQIGTPTYHALKVIYLLLKFDVPLFLFASGFFIAYAVRGGQVLSWGVLRRWISAFLWPFLIWVTLYTLASWFPVAIVEGASLAEFGRRFLVALNLAFFVPLLIQFYLLAPWVARFIHQRWRLLLGVALILQLITTGLWYVQRLGIEPSQAVQRFRELSSFFFWSWAIYFPLGMVCGVHYPTLRGWLFRNRRWLFGGAFLFALLAVIELEMIARNGAILEPSHYSILLSAYSISMILALLGVGDQWLPFSRQLAGLGVKSLGVYLAHSVVLLTVFRVVKLTVPAIMFVPLVFLGLLFTSALGFSLVLGEILARYARHSLYRYLFG